MIIILWLLFAVLVGALGSTRKIGFGMALLWAVLLSPIIGLIIVLVSDAKATQADLATTRTTFQRNSLLMVANNHFKAMEWDKAIPPLKDALELDPNESLVHFNLACAYSRLENRTEALKYLSNAIRRGHSKGAILQDADLLWIRSQPEWSGFAERGYRIEETEAKPVATGSHIEQLERLAKLKSDGVLTDDEFNTQKAKLLSV